MKPKINAVIVVEGRDDTARLKQYFEVETYETHGVGVTEEQLQEIEALAAKNEIIVFTDPDYAGKKIRSMIMEKIPAAKQAFVPRAQAVPKCKGSLGVEHADYQVLYESLEAAGAFSKGEATLPAANFEFDITQADLMKLGLVGGAGAKEKREIVGDRLHIGYCNGKQLLKRLELFKIDLATLEGVLENER